MSSISVLTWLSKHALGRNTVTSLPSLNSHPETDFEISFFFPLSHAFDLDREALDRLAQPPVPVFRILSGKVATA
jgi:hypothetical protein